MYDLEPLHLSSNCIVLYVSLKPILTASLPAVLTLGPIHYSGATTAKWPWISSTCLTLILTFLQNPSQA